MHWNLWLQHLLVIFLAVGVPLWDRYEIPRLKASSVPRKKIKYYGKLVSMLWICTLIVVGTIGLGRAFYVHLSPDEIRWLQPGSRGAMTVMGMAAGSFIAIAVITILAMANPKTRGKSARAAKRLGFFLPSTREERQWWWLICITAGVCEELVFRGFLLRYFHWGPFHLTLTQALIIASVIFGVGHLYQGIAGAISTCIIGFILECLFVITGNLLLPMVLHTLMDLRVLLMLPQGFETAE
jgi:membrane protease YdiL (CAAX protease family)